jgi:hypothetical protein
MVFDPPELAADLLALGLGSLRPLAGALASVVWSAERAKVLIPMIVTGPDVVHIGRPVPAYPAFGHPPLTLVTVSA